MSGVSASFGIDVVAASKEIANAVAAGDDREAWVKCLVEVAFHAFKDKYNVLVFNMQQPHEDNLEGVVLCEKHDFSGISYLLWVFESGTFENKGDGGYINWGMRGAHERQGQKAIFQKMF